MGVTVATNHRMKVKKDEKLDDYMNLAREQKKLIEHEGDGEPNCSWSPWNSAQEPGKETD